MQVVESTAATRKSDLGGGVHVWRAGGGTGGCDASRRSRRRRPASVVQEGGNRRLRRVKAISAAAFALGVQAMEPATAAPLGDLGGGAPTLVRRRLLRSALPLFFLSTGFP